MLRLSARPRSQHRRGRQRVAASLRGRLGHDLEHLQRLLRVPSELLVALALRHGERLVEESRQLLLRNLPVLDDLLQRRAELFEWIRPRAGPVGFARVAGVSDVRAWCERIAEEADVLLLPGAVYDEPQHVRLGFVRANLPDAVAGLDAYLG